MWDSHSAKSSQLQTLEAEVATLRAMVAQQGNHGRPKPGSVSDAANRDKPKVVPGKCWATGCQQKVVGWTSTNNWKLCGTCLLKLKGSGIPIKLKDGNTFGSKSKAYRAQLAWFDAQDDGTKTNALALAVIPQGKKSKAQKNRRQRAAKATAKGNAASKKGEEGKDRPPNKKAKLAIGWEATPAEDLFYQG